MTRARRSPWIPAEIELSRARRTVLLGRLVLGVYAFGALALLTPASALEGMSAPVAGPLALICGALTAVVATSSNLVFSGLSAACALFAEDPSAVYWFWQKLSFVFGGLLFPLDLYPRTLSSAADLTPFPALLDASSRVALGAEPSFAWHTLLALGCFIAFKVISVRFAARRAPRGLGATRGDRSKFADSPIQAGNAAP
jgi:ABC-type uncharacterized transport system permease subunit